MSEATPSLIQALRRLVCRLRGHRFRARTYSEARDGRPWTCRVCGWKEL